MPDQTEVVCPSCHELRRIKARGICARCYQRDRRRKTGSVERPRAVNACETCGRADAKRYVAGKCVACYDTSRRRAAGIEPRKPAAPPLLCKVCGNPWQGRASGMCRPCYLKDLASRKREEAKNTPQAAPEPVLHGVWESNGMAHWNASGEWPWTCPHCERTFQGPAYASSSMRQEDRQSQEAA